MQPSPAEIARTLAAGRLPGTAHVACRPGPHAVAHATDPMGRILILANDTTDPIAAALRPVAGTDDTAMVIEVTDVPPVAGSPVHGRLWVSGWMSPLDGAPARLAALDYADVHACGDLLDVGRGATIFRMEVAEVRIERCGVTTEVDPDEYAAAEPDPLGAIESDLLVDLADHHQPEMTAFINRQLRDAGQSSAGEDPRVVRLDRYGFVVSLGVNGPRARLAFPTPIADRAELARLLHPVLCRRCTPPAAGS
ncbi:DUF2470 domain-containing protein [Micromonospora sp. NBC_01813]|uniref:DUF2470 domain-containing protein n=1 Tax=Micromonospora sp. NBC_01813 TaxID=2975988 RepID=UPI002DDABA27|nr:DUF2470 domain-containing protein [Micromonospora sp. NBC_01813]WSA09723.1 DUF2470 domain-containing protein [Micromonospora sp. NBC_01813]